MCYSIEAKRIIQYSNCRLLVSSILSRTLQTASDRMAEHLSFDVDLTAPLDDLLVNDFMQPNNHLQQQQHSANIASNNNNNNSTILTNAAHLHNQQQQQQINRQQVRYQVLSLLIGLGLNKLFESK